MQRAVLVALLVALGCSAVLAVSPPCAPQKFTTGINVLVSGVYGAQETGTMVVDFDINAVSVNITSGVTASNEPFIGTYLYVNNTGYWIQEGSCFPTNLTAFGPVQCLQANGNYSNIVVAGVNATQYTIINPTNSSAYIYTSDIYMIPISYQEFDWAEDNSPANSTGILYNNPSYEVDPNVFVVPAICENGPTGKTMIHENTHVGRIIKKVARLQ